jgi:hypothetical protein
MPGMAGVPGPKPARGRSSVMGLTRADRDFLLRLQRQAILYFLENQVPGGLILDRQHNWGPRRAGGWCSTSATGMGLIALALASAPPHRLLTTCEAVARVRAALEAAERLPEDRGVRPHFVDASTGAVVGSDALSTIDTAWLLAGALWAAAFLRDRDLEARASRLYDRVDWLYWTAPERPGPPGLLRHGQDYGGRFLDDVWDRLNGETIFLYVLAAGADGGRALASAPALQPFYGTVAGWRFNNADLGLFVFQYGLDLLDLRSWRAPGALDLMAEAAVATAANRDACRGLADTFATYRRCWGLSAGDGPGVRPEAEGYRPYSPSGPIDGTAHVMATLAAVAHQPEAVLENLRAARRVGRLDPLGQYGFSNFNIDRRWVGRDLVGIDAGAAVLALDNALQGDRIRNVFHELPCVPRGLERLGFTRVSAVRQAS